MRTIICSSCGFSFETIAPHAKYCPDCKAKGIQRKGDKLPKNDTSEVRKEAIERRARAEAELIRRAESGETTAKFILLLKQGKPSEAWRVRQVGALAVEEETGRFIDGVLCGHSIHDMDYWETVNDD